MFACAFRWSTYVMADEREEQKKKIEKEHDYVNGARS